MGKNKKGSTGPTKIIKNKSLLPHKTGNDIPKTESKQEKWFKMREEQIRKKRGW